MFSLLWCNWYIRKTDSHILSNLSFLYFTFYLGICVLYITSWNIVLCVQMISKRVVLVFVSLVFSHVWIYHFGLDFHSPKSCKSLLTSSLKYKILRMLALYAHFFISITIVYKWNKLCKVQWCICWVSTVWQNSSISYITCDMCIWVDKN